MIYFIHPNQPRCKLKHVIPQRYDDELGVLCPLLDIARHDRHIPEVQRRIDLVHHIKWRGLIMMERKHQSQTA